MELLEEYICKCIEKGVPVIQSDLDEGLGDYPDNFFDYVVLSRTLHVVNKPNLLLKDMLRVGKTGIVSFPKFWILQSSRSFIFQRHNAGNKGTTL